MIIQYIVPFLFSLLTMIAHPHTGKDGIACEYIGVWQLDSATKAVVLQDRCNEVPLTFVYKSIIGQNQWVTLENPTFYLDEDSAIWRSDHTNKIGFVAATR